MLFFGKVNGISMLLVWCMVVVSMLLEVGEGCVGCRNRVFIVMICVLLVDSCLIIWVICVWFGVMVLSVCRVVLLIEMISIGVVWWIGLC